jgi:hypothetical protein
VSVMRRPSLDRRRPTSPVAEWVVARFERDHRAGAGRSGKLPSSGQRAADVGSKLNMHRGDRFALRMGATRDATGYLR